MILATLAFAVAHFAAIFLLALSSYVLGRRLVFGLRFNSLGEEIAVCTGLGLGATAYLVFLLGTLGLLSAPVLLGALLLLHLLCLSVWRALVARTPRGLRTLRSRPMALGIGVLVVVFLTPILLLPLYPPTAFDATMYHLALAKIYDAQQRIVLAEFVRFPLFPQTNEMLFALALQFFDDITAQLVQCLMMGLVTLALYAWGRRAFAPRVGALAAGLWLASPLVISLGTVGLIDMGATMFAALATLAFFNWVQERDTRWLIVAALFAGCAAGSKYSALLYPALFGLVTLYFAVRERNLRYPLLFGAIALAVAAPWYLRSFYYVRNPVEPLLPQFFGYHLWNADDVAYQTKVWAGEGMGHGLLDLLRLPWDLLQHQAAFGENPPVFTIFFALLPLTVFWAIRSGYIRALLAVAGVATVAWFAAQAEIQRYWLPTLPLLVLATAAALDRAVSWLPAVRRFLSRAPVMALLFVVATLPGWLWAADRVQNLGPAPTTQAERDAYLAAKLPSYLAHQWLNAHAAPGYRLYGLYDEDMFYFTDGTHMGNTFGTARWQLALNALGSGEALYNALRLVQTDYFLVTSHRRKVTLPDDEFFKSHFELVFEDTERGVKVFRLSG